MSNLELVLNMLAEATTTEISKENTFLIQNHEKKKIFIYFGFSFDEKMIEIFFILFP